jgi:diaminopimelate decarboxylase
LVEAIEAAGIPLKHIDLGGGLGINYTGEMPPSADDLWKLLFKRMNKRGHGHRKIMLEPGRSLVGNAGVCVTEVLFIKPGELRNFCIVDAGMNDIPRPAMYEAYHDILEVTDPSYSSVPELECDVVGPVCESGDWLGRDRNLRVRQGDYLAVLSTGAYCMSMASNYNARARPVELMVDGKQVHVIRDREDSASQMLHEKLI